jgi:hypothetical protein
VDVRSICLPGRQTRSKSYSAQNTASIRGTAPPGRTVACRNLDDMRLSGQSRVVDQSGQFRIEGLAPGRYRVAAAESFDAGPLESGREIAVQEGETATVNLRN